MSIGGIDWLPMAWITIAAIVLTGGALAFLRSASFVMRQWGKHLTRRRFRGPIAVLVVAAVTAAGSQAQTQRRQTPASITTAAYSRHVFQICAGAVLFEGHALGTSPRPLDAAADISASTRRRLAEIAQLSAPTDEAQTIARWLAVQQQQADTYAQNLVQLYDLIAAVSTSDQATQASQPIRATLDAPYSPRLAGRLELKLECPTAREIDRRSIDHSDGRSQGLHSGGTVSGRGGEPPPPAIPLHDADADHPRLRSRARRRDRHPACPGLS